MSAKMKEAPPCHVLLRDAYLHDLLFTLDQDLATEAQGAGCRAAVVGCIARGIRATPGAVPMSSATSTPDASASAAPGKSVGGGPRHLRSAGPTDILPPHSRRSELIAAERLGELYRAAMPDGDDPDGKRSSLLRGTHTSHPPNGKNEMP